MKYEHYTLEDFLADDRFKNWVLAPTEAENTFWQEWIQQHPEKRELTAQGREIIQHLSQKDDEAAMNAQSARIWQRLTASVQENKEVQLPVRTAYKYIAWRKIAAVVTLLIISGLVYYWISSTSHTIEVTTRYSEIRSLVLPDSSVIVLNANSSVAYQDRWSMDTPREVWLKGEAFFEVKNLSGQTPAKVMPGHSFIVHTEDISVEVLGTQFNIIHRHNTSSVVLSTGSVKVKSTDRQADILLKPGERIEYSKASQSFAREMVNPEVYTAWRNRQYMFDDTPIEKIAEMLEDNHGLEVTVAVSAKKRTFTANVPSDNVEMLLDLLTEALDLKITRQGNVIRIE